MVFSVNILQGGTYMFGFIKKLFGGGTEAAASVAAPYKVLEPVVSTPVVVETPVTAPAVEKTPEVVVKHAAKPTSKKKPYVKKKPAAKIVSASKPAAKKPKAKPNA